MFYASFFVLLLLVVLLTQCSTVGKSMRHKPDAGTPSMDKWYIESTVKPQGLPYSCSFVEYDGTGDFIDFAQHQAAWHKVDELTKNGQRLLLVQYCHGWKNNSQSGDVVEFTNFLRMLANSPDLRERGFRVHGLYLGWRGNAFKPRVDPNGNEYKRTKTDFGGPIVNSRYHRHMPLVPWLGEQLSYWRRKQAANEAAGPALARTVLACAHLAKKRRSDNRVFLIGHSFGAIMLEQSVGHALVGSLAQEYPWFGEAPPAESTATPFDMLLMVNSAAPSTQSKQLNDVLWAHHGALMKAKPAPPKRADAPLVISVTSTGDWATRNVSRVANCFSFLYPGLQRTYTDVLTDGSRDKEGREISAGKIHQSYYYARTPGHNPLLVDHWVVPESSPPRKPCDCHEDAVLKDNLDLNVAVPEVFFTSRKGETGKPATGWRITDDINKTNDPDWKKMKGLHAKERESNYWTIRCPKEIIGGHNDIWNQSAMEMYASLFRLAVVRSKN